MAKNSVRHATKARTPCNTLAATRRTLSRGMHSDLDADVATHRPLPTKPINTASEARGARKRTNRQRGPDHNTMKLPLRIAESVETTLIEDL